jgi:predicted anti-sigma-YlaC factor YlaD
MLNCKEVTELCSQELERTLGLGERISLGAHLMMCSGCSNFRRQMSALRKIARDYADGRAATAAPGENSADRPE